MSLDYDEARWWFGWAGQSELETIAADALVEGYCQGALKPSQ